jgi:S1-C subfamily serine protease
MADQIHRLILAGGLFLISLAAGADMVETIARVKTSVVIVGTYQKTDSPQMKLRGTGFVVGDGLTVATNAHVIGDLNEASEPASLIVQLPATGHGQSIRQARLWALDKTHDLALLKIDGPALPAVTLRDSDTVKEGLAVAFTGFPIGGALGFSPVTHRGMVSAVTPIALPSGNAQQLKENVIRRIKSGSFDIFQLDATAYPGNSGGPLYDAETGEVVGIINMVLVKDTKEAALSHPSGISYAIPANYLRNLIVNGK